MGIENVRADPLEPARSYGLDVPEVAQPQSWLDAPQAKAMHGKLMGSYQYERSRQAANRYQMSVDADYYDSIQLTDDDIAELEGRGQAPLVYNLVKRTADWIIGTEKRTRIDYKVLGRDKSKGEVEGARIKTDVLKYLSDINKTPFHRSQAFREAVISGLGWIESGVRADEDEEPIYSRKESWRNVLHDSHSVELDGSDMMYIHRHKYVDIELAVAMFPQRERVIAAYAMGSIQAEDEERNEWYLGNRISGQDYLIGQAGQYPSLSSMSGYLDNSRDRVKLIESWFRKPVRDTVLLAKQLPMFHGLRYDAKNDDMRHAVLIGDATVVERVRLAAFYAISTEGCLLATGRSPYRHNQFPFTPIWCYRRGRDNAPYGIIRPIRDPQDGFNRRMSKSIFALSAYRVTMDSDSIDPKVMSYEDVRREAGRPDALIVKKSGKEIKVDQDRALAEGHMKLAQYEAGLIIDSSGITADNLGMDSNAQSGKAIIAKQSQGSSVTAEVFDNLRFAYQCHGEKDLSLAEQYMSEERVIRITDAKGRPSWKKINEIVENPDGTVRVLNDIAATKSDFVIDQQDFNVSLREAASQQLFELAATFGKVEPQIALRIMDMAIDQSNLPDKDEMLKQIREITGFRPAEDALTPEEKQELEQQQQQQQQQQQEQAEQQKQAAMADIRVKLADAKLKEAQAEEAMAKAEQARNELAKGASILTSEQEARWNELNAAHEEAKKALGEHQANVASLTQQLKERAGEIEAKERAEKHRAEQERAAAEYAAKVAADAQVHTANQQFPAAGREQQEAMADVLQAIEELHQAVADLEKHREGAEKEDEAKDAELVVKVQKAVETAIATNAKEAPKESEPAELKAIHAISEQVKQMGEAIRDAMQSMGGKRGPMTISLPSGKQVRVEPDGDKPTKKPKQEKR